MEKGYEQDMRIDETALDVEWLDQPMLMLKYARIAADAKKELDLAKENLELVKADLDKEIRKHPDDFDIVKITEPLLLNAIISQDEYKEANSKVIEAQYDVNIANGAVKAVEGRKDSLENLVKLHGQQYFAGPSMPRDLTWERKEHQKKVDAGIANVLTRRNRQQ